MDHPIGSTILVPKRRIGTIGARRKKTDLFTVIAIGIFVAVMIAWGGIKGYQFYLKTRIAGLEDQLQIAQEQIDTSIIFDLRAVDEKLKLANLVLAKHVNLASIFALLSDLTLTENVRFNSLTYVDSTRSPVILERAHGSSVLLAGTARNFSSLAYQSELFTASPDINDVTFSSIEVETETGFVNFDVSFNLSTSLLSYYDVTEESTEDVNDLEI